MTSDASHEIRHIFKTKDSKNNRMYILYTVLAVQCYAKVTEMQLMAKTCVQYIMFKLSVPIQVC